MDRLERSAQPMLSALASMPHMAAVVQHGVSIMPAIDTTGQRGSFVGGAAQLAAVPYPQVLVAAFEQHGGGAVGMNPAAGFGGQVIAPQVTGALLAAPAAPVVATVLGAALPAEMTGVISITLLPPVSVVVLQPMAAQIPSHELTNHVAFALLVILISLF